MTVNVHIGFGSNLGDRETKFLEAVAALGRLPETRVKNCSSLYETDPEGLSDGGPSFFNAAICIETALAPHDLLDFLHEIEVTLGKSPNARSDLSRPIDLDLLLYGEDHLAMEGLEVPHPRMHKRAFVLVPLAQIASHTVHPVLKCSIAELLQSLPIEDVKRVTAAEQVFRLRI